MIPSAAFGQAQSYTLAKLVVKQRADISISAESSQPHYPKKNLYYYKNTGSMILLIRLSSKLQSDANNSDWNYPSIFLLLALCLCVEKYISTLIDNCYYLTKQKLNRMHCTINSFLVC